MMTGCQSPVGVTRVDSETVRHQLTKNVISSGETSPYTDNVLRVTDLTDAYFDDPREALNTLHHFFLAEEQRKVYVAFALAELSFLYAQKSNQPSYYLAAALYAYLYLFPENSTNPFNPFDPRGRIAADLFNRSLTSGFISKDRSDSKPAIRHLYPSLRNPTGGTSGGTPPVGKPETDQFYTCRRIGSSWVTEPVSTSRYRSSFSGRSNSVRSGGRIADCQGQNARHGLHAVLQPP